ncbi:MAG: respiratory nitrate reductase subunit gamma [Pelagibacteraceae bacterium]|nr:respiratory nitrate reductase subunit gamma [Pelagibacteraceae bacterium]
MWDNFFFIGLPYISIIMFLGGIIYRSFSGIMGRYRGKWDLSVRGDYLWTTRSTGFFGRASIGPASLCLHWGLIILFVSHLIGFIGGSYNFGSWIEFFKWVGLGGGIIFLYGASWAFLRRIFIPQVKAMSTPDDYIMLLLLILIAALGIYQSAIENGFWNIFLGRTLDSQYFQIQPDVSAISAAPLINKLHIIIAFIFFCLLSFH